VLVAWPPLPSTSSSTVVPLTARSKLAPLPPSITLTTVSLGLRLFVTVQVLSSPAASVPEQSGLIVVSQTAGSTASPLPRVSETL
jgi:hypothetical protein